MKFDLQNQSFSEPFFPDFVEKKISEFISSVKSKFEDIFKIFKKNNTEDDDTKIDDDKKIFNLKKVLRKLWKKRDDTEDKPGS